MLEYEIIGYRPELKEPMVALFSDAFGFSPLESRRYLEWKYEQNPYLREPMLFLARDGNGSVVGMRGFYGTCWRVAGETVVLPCADDFAIAPGERNKGLMGSIMRAAVETLAISGFSHVLSASGGMLTVLQSLATGWKSLGAMEPVARIGRLERIRRAIDGKAQGKPLAWRFARGSNEGDPACFARLEQSARWAASRGGSVIVESSPRAEAMAELADRCPDVGSIQHVRDAMFFRWRYDNPTRDYRFLYHERNGVLTGFLAIARYRRSKLPFNIVDWEALTDGIGAELLEKALTWGRFAAIGTWSSCYSPERRNMLAERGFTPTDLDLRARGMPCVLLKTLGSAREGDAITDGAAWNIRLIDSMQG